MPARAPRELRCEYASDPIGIGTTRPRLFWQLDDDRPGAQMRCLAHVDVAPDDCQQFFFRDDPRRRRGEMAQYGKGLGAQFRNLRIDDDALCFDVNFESFEAKDLVLHAQVEPRSQMRKYGPASC